MKNQQALSGANHSAQRGTAKRQAANQAKRSRAGATVSEQPAPAQKPTIDQMADACLTAADGEGRDDSLSLENMPDDRQYDAIMAARLTAAAKVIRDTQKPKRGEIVLTVSGERVICSRRLWKWFLAHCESHKTTPSAELSRIIVESCSAVKGAK